MVDYLENRYYLSGRAVHPNAGWQHRRRQAHSRSDLIVSFGGTLHLYENDRKYDVKKGEFLFLQQNAPSGGYKPSAGPVDFCYVLFDGDIPTDIPKHAALSDLARPRALFSLMDCYNSLAEAPRGVLNNLVQVLFCDIRMQCENQIFSGNAVAASARAWVRRNCARAITVTDAAHRFGYSADHLSRLFTREYGISLKEYITSTRLSHIDSLLDDPKYSLAEIAEMTDFQGETQFAKYYKYHKGMTPGEFRAAKKGID